MIGGKPTLSLLFLLIALIPSPARAGAPETVRFGVCMSLTGEFEGFGNVYFSGVKIRLADFNAQSGRTGLRLEMVVRDDRSNPAAAAAIVEELAVKEGVVAIIGSSSSDITLAMLAKAKEHGVMIIAPAATSVRLGREEKGVVRVLFNDDFQGKALAQFVAARLGVKRVATISNRRFDYSTSIMRAFQREFVNRGGTIAASEFYNLELGNADHHDFTPQLRRIQSANPQAVLLPDYAEAVAAILRQAQQLRFSAIFCGGDSWARDSLLLSAGNSLIGSYYVDVVDERSQTPEMRKFMSLLDRSNDITAEPASVLGYDALSLLIEALRTGHSRETIRDGLLAIKDLPLASGVITVDRREGSQKPAYIVKIVRKGNEFVREVVDVIKP